MSARACDVSYVQRIVDFGQVKPEKEGLCSACLKPMDDERVIARCSHVFHKTCSEGTHDSNRYCSVDRIQVTRVFERSQITKAAIQFQALFRGYHVRQLYKEIGEAIVGNERVKAVIMGHLMALGSKGGNLFVQGEYGTGKTTFIKGVARALQRPLYWLYLGYDSDYNSLLRELRSIRRAATEAGEMNPLICVQVDKGHSLRTMECLAHLLDESRRAAHQENDQTIFFYCFDGEAPREFIWKSETLPTTERLPLAEKVIVAREKLLTSCLDELGWKRETMQVSDRLLAFIVERYAAEEVGVLHLRKALRKIFYRVNLWNLIGKVELPFELTRETVTKILGDPGHDQVSSSSLH